MRGSGPLVFRNAARADLAALIAMLADDFLGSGRGEIIGEPVAAEYVAAFEAIEADRNSRLIVAERAGDAGVIVGTFQLTLIAGLAYRGATRAIIESVRIASPHRGRGLGEALIRHAIALAREGGAHSLQLSTNKARLDAHRFYRKLGFTNSHEGFKLDLG